jgi:hypothetical protein
MPVNDVVPTQNTSAPEASSSADSLRLILESRSFERAETLKKVLIYLWEQRGKNISEYAIATDALGRREDFDPKTDATVRVQVSRLRRKLKEFYEEEGQQCPLKLSIPVGTHMLEVSEAPSAETAETPVIVPQIPPPSLATRLLPVSLVLCTMLAILSGWLLWSRFQVPTPGQDHRASPIAFWSNFIGGTQKSQIVLPIPVFYRFPGHPTIRMRDIDMNDFQNWSSSPVMKEMVQRFGAPAPEQFYTVTSDTFAAVHLVRYLDSVGLGSNLIFSNSATMSMDDLEHSNEIAFGTHATLNQFQPYLDRMNFSMMENEAGVQNRSPQNGEPPIFRAVSVGGEHGEHIIVPGIIAVLPGKNPSTRLLILQARHTDALVSMLTSITGTEMLAKMRKDKGNPMFYEAVVNIEMNGDHMIRVWPVAMRAFLSENSH